MQRRNIRTLVVWVSGLLLVFYQVLGVSWASEQEGEAMGIKPEVVANYIHAVIEADRTLYTTHVVDRMQETGTVIASEGWKKRNALPLPAQMLLLAGLKVGESGLGLQFRLASLFPIYERNGPTTEFEMEGLSAVEKNPEKPYTGVITRGDKRYFKAIYADKAVSKACVNCHNTHILSAKRDRKVGDVMGGIIISFPLD